MDCLDDNAIAGFVQGTLAADARERVEEHVDGCEACRRLLSDAARAWAPTEAESDDLGPGAVLDGRFAIEEVAGHGGMGVVYRARDVLSNEPVAVKVLKPGVVAHEERFAREAALLAGLSHPAIVRHVAHGTAARGARWLAMEWLEGESLSQRLTRGPLPVAEALALGQRVAEALGAAHRAGVVHRDVKPQNLLLVGGQVQRVKLIDFGIARAERRVGATSLGAWGGVVRELTGAGAAVGTPGYMAPEQARSARNVDARADVFALGCVLYRCLTGRHAFTGRGEIAVLAKILLEDPAPIGKLAPDVPRELVALVERMLVKEPWRRPADGAAVAAALAAIQGDPDEAPTRARSSQDPSTPPPTPSGHPTVAGVGARERRVVCVVLVGAAEGGGRELESPEGSSPTPLADIASSHGARVEPLADGSLVVCLSAAEAAVDHARRAAQIALAMQPFASHSPIVLATGQAVLSGGPLVGAVLDGAAELLANTPPGVIRVDPTTERLLEDRFEIATTSGVRVLVRERDPFDEPRKLLGRESPSFGREPERALLAATYRQAAGEPVARAALVVGPPGIGKTRLCRDLVSTLRREGERFAILFARGEPFGRHAPLAVLGAMLRRAAGIRDGEPIEGRADKSDRMVDRLLPGAAGKRVRMVIGDLVGAVRTSDEALAAIRGDPRSWTEAVTDACRALLDAQCARGPVLVVLEDVHWIDAATLRVVDALLGELADRPLFVLCLARPEADDPLPRRWRERDVQEVRLGPLTRRASERLVVAALGEQGEAVARIVERAAGNPFYLEELVRAHASGRIGELPETVLGLVQARLDELGEPAKRILRAASVLGTVFWRGAVAMLLGPDAEPMGLDDWLDELLRREVLVASAPSRFPDERELAFRHDLVREAAYEMLTQPDRELGHRRAGAWLADHGETAASVLAHHFERGADHERAIEAYERAARQAVESFDRAAALEAVAAGLRLGAQGEQLGHLYLARAEVQTWGDQADALASGLRALELFPRASEPWFAAVARSAAAAGGSGDRERLHELSELLFATWEQRPAGPTPIVALLRVALNLVFFGDNAPAVRFLDLVDEPLAEMSANHDLQARYEFVHALLVESDDPAQYGARMERAAAHATAVGDRRVAESARNNVAYAFILLGAYARAIALLREVLEAGETIGLHYLANVARHNLGIALALSGEVEEGRRIEQRAEEAFEQLGDWRMLGFSRTYRAVIELVAGNLGAAERIARAAAEPKGGPAQWRPQALATLAEVMSARGRHDEALALADEALPLLPGASIHEPLVRLVRAEALHGLGDRSAAVEELARGAAVVARRAARIDDDELRRGFLERVRENARIARLAQAWSSEP